MAFKFSMTLSGDKLLNKKLRNAMKYARDLRPAFKIIAVEMYYSINENFEKQSKPVGGKWQKLSDSYQKFKQKIGKQRILQITGALKNSIISRSGGRGTQGSITKMDRMKLQIGTQLKYAAVHQFGYKNIPARPYLGFKKKDIRLAKKHLSNHLLKDFK